MFCWGRVRSNLLLRVFSMCGGGGWERDGLGGRDDCGLGGSSGFSVVDH